ncbi:hypothetical protein VNI00_003889 [Paramarasmius palmivorus]|uniref:Subtilisin-like protease n=1 Tax=Paramarasmius palmivorus TaxID=297713 RepID=A0AAW0DNQ8_9AGAR
MGFTAYLATLCLSVLVIRRASAMLQASTKRYIVEMEECATPGSLHRRFYDSLGDQDVPHSIDREFNAPGLFVGAALTLENTEDVSKVAKASGVKAVRPLHIFPGPEPRDFRQSLAGPAPGLLAEQSPNMITGVTKLHAEGYTGVNITIGIIDSGVDYMNIALGGGFGSGFKVIGGYDFVGDDYNGTRSSVPVPDPYPMDCNGHGTHGIIGADPSANPYNISGVAYNASINAYRIFGCVGGASEDLIVAALLRGAEEKNDILSLSLGGKSGWTETSTAVVASRIAKSGIAVAIAAGNDGDSGAWYFSGPADGLDVIAVASLDNPSYPLQSVTISGVEHDPIPYYSFNPLPINGTLPIYATSNDTSIPDDACSPLPNNTPDLSGYIVIVRRGNCTFVEKLTNIAAKGGKQTLIYNNVEGFASILVGNFTAALILPEDGEFLVQQFASGNTVKVNFPQSGGLMQYHDPKGGLISDFSRRVLLTRYGPNFDLFFKPAIAAPGGNILSTLPVANGSYGLDSGTSMATPFVAGSIALLLQAMGKSPDVVQGIRSRLQTTANYVPSNHSEGDPLQTTIQQGAGLVDVFNAIHATTWVTPGEFLLNDTAHFNGKHSFHVRNTGSSEKSYNIRHIPAGTALTIAPGLIVAAPGPVPLIEDHASVSFSTMSFLLGPGQIQEVDVTFTPPNALDPATLPIYSGFIQVDAEDESLHVSYMGVAGSLIEKQIFDPNATALGVPLPVVLDAVGNPQDGPKNYTFNETSEDYPTLVFRLAFGTPLILVDLVDPNTNIATSFNPSLSPDGSKHPVVETLGLLDSFTYVSRDNETDFEVVTVNSTSFENGTAIPDGSYRFLLRALRVTGDPDNESNYESWLSPIVGFFPGEH